MTKKNDHARKEPKPYHQLPGEPHMWYDRFLKFCLYGPSRTFSQCYRAVMLEKDLLASLAVPGSGAGQSVQDLESLAARRDRANRGKKLPGSWKRRIEQFDWLERAAAWDADRREENLKLKEHADNLLYQFAPYLIQFLIDLVKGRVKDGDGNIKQVDDLNLRRLTAIFLWKEAGIGLKRPLQDEDDGKVEIVGLKIMEQLERDDGLI